MDLIGLMLGETIEVNNVVGTTAIWERESGAPEVGGEEEEGSEVEIGMLGRG